MDVLWAGSQQDMQSSVFSPNANSGSTHHWRCKARGAGSFRTARYVFYLPREKEAMWLAVERSECGVLQYHSGRHRHRCCVLCAICYLQC